MLSIAERRPAWGGAWSVRIAAFSIAIVVLAILLHRIFELPTPVALNLFAVGFLGAVVALLAALVGMADIWRNGRSGLSQVLSGSAMAALLLAWPASQLPVARRLPPINDVSTDIGAPPAFVEIARLRGPGANDTAYPGVGFAALQQRAYPDLQPFFIQRSSDEAYDLALEALRRQKMRIVAEEPPGDGPGRPGHIEAVERTLVLGFRDDVVVRVTGDARTARIDVRSASRYGQHDLGRNAERVRRILKEILVRVENSVAAAPGESARRPGGKSSALTVKQQQIERARMLEDRRRRLDRARSGAPREPAQKATPR